MRRRVVPYGVVLRGLFGLAGGWQRRRWLESYIVGNDEWQRQHFRGGAQLQARDASLDFRSCVQRALRVAVCLQFAEAAGRRVRRARQPRDAGTH